MSASADAVPIAPEGAGGAKPGWHIGRDEVKLYAMLFAFFMFVSSRLFVGGFVAAFGAKAVQGRDPTAWGVVIQGVCLVFLFILGEALVRNGYF